MESFTQFIIRTLGRESGRRYLAEEYMERLVAKRPKINFDKVPADSVWKDRAGQEWHRGETERQWLSEEASEPWHPSLRKQAVGPDHDASLFFNRNPQWYMITAKILEIVYGAGGIDEGDRSGAK